MRQEGIRLWAVGTVAILVAGMLAVPTTGLAASGPTDQHVRPLVAGTEDAAPCEAPHENPQCLVDEVNLCLAGEPAAAPKCVIRVFRENCDYQGLCPFIGALPDAIQECLSSIKNCLNYWPPWDRALA